MLPNNKAEYWSGRDQNKQTQTLKNAAQRLAVPSVANGSLRRFIGQY